MAKLVNLIGQKFNRLTVIDRAPNRGTKAVWVCKCDCGNITNVDTYHLTHGKVVSCGCYKSEQAAARSFIDLTGQRFGRLTAIERVENKGKATMWRCMCDCGNVTVVAAGALRSNEVRSCGCLQKELTSLRNTTHGMANSRLHRIWRGMKSRCYNQNTAEYQHYGGKGVKVCDQWKNNFEDFYRWAIENGYRDDLSIDRIDCNGDYSPENCKWSNIIEQANNKMNNIVLTYNGETHTLAEWSGIVGISRCTLRDRLKRYGWSVERTLTEPVRGKK